MKFNFWASKHGSWLMVRAFGRGRRNPAKLMTFTAISYWLIQLSLILSLAVPSHAAESEAEAIPPGTVITMQNWQQYRQFMQDGMLALFEGKYFWKLPADFQMEIGPTHDIRVPDVYVRNTEKYSKLVKIVNLPNGGHTISGYVTGRPFPNPTEPLRGWKILVDSWYAYIPWLLCGPSNHVILTDRYNNHSEERISLLYRMLNYISDADRPISDPGGPGIYYSEWIQVLQPEQSKYTTQLTFYYTDPTKPEDLFLFIPALRRTLRLSVAARCSPVVGTDFVQDDVRQLFNGGIARFDVKQAIDRKILYLGYGHAGYWVNPDNYFKPLFFPKPIIGKWEVRDNYLLDVRRIPSQQKGYCFGKRMLYVDKQSFIETWADIYDSNMKLWKIESFQTTPAAIENQGLQMYAGKYVVDNWDVQNSHMTLWITERFGTDSQCAPIDGVDYSDVKRYSSVAGLSEILR